MRRISYKMLKQWLAESEFAQAHGMTLHSWNDYYHILDDCNNNLISGKTPGEVWEKFNLMKTGYYMGVNNK